MYGHEAAYKTPCAAETVAMLSCWAATKDINNVGDCAATAKALQDCMRASVSFIFVHLPFTHASVRARPICCHLGVIPICFFYPMGGVLWICPVLMTCACRLWVRSASKQLSTSTLHGFRRSSNELAYATIRAHIL